MTKRTIQQRGRRKPTMPKPIAIEEQQDRERALLLAELEGCKADLAFLHDTGQLNTQQARLLQETIAALEERLGE